MSKTYQTVSIKDCYDLISGNAFNIRVKEGNDDVIFISGNDVAEELKDNHFEKRFTCFIDLDASEYARKLDMCDSLYKKWQRFTLNYGDAFQRIYDALKSSYNPIENFDRYEDILRTYEGGENVSRDYSGKETDTVVNSGINNNTMTAGARDMSTTNQRSADDSSTFVNDSKTDNHNASATDTNENTFSSSTETEHNFINRNDLETRAFVDRNDIETSHLHGNIGVTTNQQMISAEYEMRLKLNLFYDLVKMFTDKYLFY